MKINNPVRTSALYLLIICAGWIWPTIGRAQVSLNSASKDQITSGVINRNIVIMPQLNKLNFGFGRHKGIEYFYEKTLSRIFFQDKELSAKIVDVSIESSEIALELSHPVLGTGNIRFDF
ncbi:MAG: hypothetical protein PVF09_09675, partial [Desulfobacterales bacterium]